MKLPSIKTLESAFPGKGKTLRTLLESPAAVRAHPAAVELARQCYNAPSLCYMRLTALNAEAETFGIEAVWRADGSKDCANGRPAFEYLNTGDTYAPTIIRKDTGRYIVASWGDIVERGDYE
jgi:hypothetical protein